MGREMIIDEYGKQDLERPHFEDDIDTLRAAAQFMRQSIAGRTYAEVAGDTDGARHAADRIDALCTQRPSRLCVLVLGDFKSGKSTLVNALLGRVVVVSDVFEMTSAITRILPSPNQDERVLLSRAGLPGTKTVSLSEFVDLQVKQADDLRHGRDPSSNSFDQASIYISSNLPLELIDTPGLGATRSNERQAVDAITSADVILWTLDAENLGGARETAMLNRVKESGQPLICVVTKADTLDASERLEATEYISESLIIPTSNILLVEALQSLSGDFDGGIGNLRRMLSAIAPSRALLRERALLAQAADIGAEISQCLDRVRKSIIIALTDMDENRSSLLQTAEVVTDDICSEIASVLRGKIQYEIDGILSGYRKQVKITEQDFVNALEESVKNIRTQDFWEAMKDNVEERFQLQWTEGLRSQISILEGSLSEARRDTNTEAVRLVEGLYQEQIHRALVKEEAVRLAVEGGIAGVLTAASGFGLVLGALVAAPTLYNYYKVSSAQKNQPTMEELLMLLRDELFAWRDEVIRENIERFRTSLLAENIRIAEVASTNYGLQRGDWPMSFVDLQALLAKCSALYEGARGMGQFYSRALPAPPS